MAFESLSDKLQNAFKKLRSKGSLTEADVKEAMKEVKQVVEGVYSAKAALGLATKYNVDMPIVEQINEVLFNNKTVAQGMRDLLDREKKQEYSAINW